MRAAYHQPDPLVAQVELEALAGSWTAPIPARQAAPGRPGRDPPVAPLGMPPTLARTLPSTDSIESMIEICRDHAANVKRWRDGQMVLRCIAAGIGEAATQFRRVNGFSVSARVA